MATPRLNKPVSPNAFYLLTYQSNESLNEVHHNRIKYAIVEYITTQSPIIIKDIHSYVHGNIIIESEAQFPQSIFDLLISCLKRFDDKSIPDLFFSLALVHQDNKEVNYVYIEGDLQLDINFRDSIKDFIDLT